MNPGPWLGGIAVAVAYAVVLGALVIFMSVMASKRRKLERRRRDLKEPESR
jgi:hypothetical protein